MIVLIILIVVFILSLCISKVTDRRWHFVFSGNLAMCAMLFFTAAGHFAFTKGMEMMMPPFLPFKKGFVLLTGVLETAAGIGLLIPRWRRLTATWLIIFFVLILPANIYASMMHVDLQKADYNGAGTEYLWFRIPLQLLLIAWVYFFGIYKKPEVTSVSHII